MLGKYVIVTSVLLSKLANEVMNKYGAPVLVFRGLVFRVSVDESKLTPQEFLGYIGTSSTFAILSNNGQDYTICSVKIINEPEVYRLKIKSVGLAEIVECKDELSVK